MKTIRSRRPPSGWSTITIVVEDQIREIRDDLPAGLLSQAAEARRRPFGGLSAGLRRCLGLRCPYRQPFRCGYAVPVRAGLSAGATADDRRAVGGRDHAADRARREPAAPGRADRRRSRGAPSMPTPWPIVSWVQRAMHRSLPLAGPAADSSSSHCRRLSPSSSSSAYATRTQRSTPALHWLDERLSGAGTTAEEIVRDEHQQARHRPT